MDTFSSQLCPKQLWGSLTPWAVVNGTACTGVKLPVHETVNHLHLVLEAVVSDTPTWRRCVSNPCTCSEIKNSSEKSVDSRARVLQNAREGKWRGFECTWQRVEEGDNVLVLVLAAQCRMPRSHIFRNCRAVCGLLQNILI